MTQLNTPYPATAYLTGFLRLQGVNATQADPAIELVLRLFSKKGLMAIADILDQSMRAQGLKGPNGLSGTHSNRDCPEAISFFLREKSRYFFCIEPVIRFLQGKDPSLALRIVSREFLPEGPRFRALTQFSSESGEPTQSPLEWAFGSLGVQDQAKYLASLMIDDLADVIRLGIDPRFELSRYGEKLAASAPTFDPLLEALQAEPTFVDQTLDEITRELIERERPDIVGLTAPFPGNVYGAFRIAQTVRKVSPQTTLILGGGYPNTELRELSDPRVFDFIDYVTLDDGERPFLCLLEHLQEKRFGKNCYVDLLRTFGRENWQVVLKTT
jgi:hypothetical protein